MKAVLLQRDRFDFDGGTIVEMVIWKVPKPVEGCPHAYKYRLFSVGLANASSDMIMSVQRAIIVISGAGSNHTNSRMWRRW